MDRVLSTIRIKGNDDLQSMLSSLFVNPKTHDSDWLLSQFYEQISDVDTNCVGSCSAELSNVFILLLIAAPFTVTPLSVT